jgi:hypothetical protein
MGGITVSTPLFINVDRTKTRRRIDFFTVNNKKIELQGPFLTSRGKKIAS